MYWVYPDEEEPFQVLCDITTDGGGWTTFKRRMDGSVDFYVDWESYKKGFGNLEGEVWLGNDYLHRLTASANMLFRTDMEDYEGDRRFAEYTAGDSLVSESKPIKYVISISLSVVCIKNIRLLKREISKFLPPRKKY